MAGCSYSVPGVPKGDEADDLRTLERLVDDLARYAAEGGPTAVELAAAPVIRRPQLISDPVAFRLAGLVTGHPLVAAGPAVSSRLYAIDLNRTWIRSYSRLWRVEGWPADGPTHSTSGWVRH